uniref:Uncharacterized protein n=1 Tax=Glossina pallidipes TaxID=7398 RepID=A0A1B0A8J0_GLOPL
MATIIEYYMPSVYTTTECEACGTGKKITFRCWFSENHHKVSLLVTIMPSAGNRDNCCVQISDDYMKNLHLLNDTSRDTRGPSNAATHQKTKVKATFLIRFIPFYLDCSFTSRDEMLRKTLEVYGIFLHILSKDKYLELKFKICAAKANVHGTVKFISYSKIGLVSYHETVKDSLYLSRFLHEAE